MKYISEYLSIVKNVPAGLPYAMHSSHYVAKCSIKSSLPTHPLTNSGHTDTKESKARIMELSKSPSDVILEL